MSNRQLTSAELFSDRVENYIKFRPGYPKEILDVLAEECDLSGDSVIADAGSGTGILSEMFLKQGNVVFGVEPNKEMREAAERLLANYAKFTSINGTAEATNLPPRSVDFITVAQAFHWFRIEKTRQEFLQILKPAGWVILIWNDRKIDSSPFSVAYEQLLREQSIDYEKVDHKNINQNDLQQFFCTKSFKQKIFQNKQVFDFTGLKGRLLSTSYVPSHAHPNYANMIDALKMVFQKHQGDNRVEMEYETKMYCGQLLSKTEMS